MRIRLSVLFVLLALVVAACTGPTESPEATALFSDGDLDTAAGLSNVQRLETDLAVAAGAVGMIIFNQGNAPDRNGVFAGTFGGPIDIVAVPASFDLGVDLAGVGGLEMLIDTDPNDGAALRVQALAGLDWDRAEEFVPLIGKIDVDGNITRFDE